MKRRRLRGGVARRIILPVQEERNREVLPSSAAAFPTLIASRDRRTRATQSWLRFLAFFSTLPFAFGGSVRCLIEFTGPGRRVSGIAGAAAVLVTWGWLVSFGGPVDRLRWAWMRRRLRRCPREPWLADHRWSPRGPSASILRQAAGGVGYVPWLFVYVAFVLLRFAPHALLPAAGLFGTLVVWRVWRATSGGRAHLTFTRFPYVPGEPAELHFGMSEGGADFLRARFLLQRIEEAPGGCLGQAPVCVLRQCIPCVPPGGALPGPGVDVRLVFDVPADAGGTALSAPFPIYWELEVSGDTTKGEFLEQFLVPIYERPAGAAA